MDFDGSAENIFDHNIFSAQAPSRTDRGRTTTTTGRTMGRTDGQRTTATTGHDGMGVQRTDDDDVTDDGTDGQMTTTATTGRTRRNVRT